MVPAIAVVLVIVVVLGIRLIAGSLDSERIRRYISDRGGTVIEQEWAPLGKGWLGSPYDRIYRVVHQDAEGRIHDAACKTSAFAGVYYTDDTVRR